MAYLYCRGRQHNSKEFHEELEAARWYDAKATELLGPAAVLNFPQVALDPIVQSLQNLLCQFSRSFLNIQLTLEA